MIFSKKNKDKKFIIDAFSKYIDKEVVEDIFKNGEILSETESEIKNIYYIVYQVKDDSFERINTLIEKSLNVVLKHGGIYDIISSFVIVYYKTNDDNNENRNVNLANKLLDSLKKDIRIIHGKAPGALINLGTKNNLNFGPLIINFGEKIEKLVKTEFGEISSD